MLGRLAIGVANCANVTIELWASDRLVVSAAILGSSNAVELAPYIFAPNEVLWRSNQQATC